jgi:hypothetical protein
MPIDEYRSNRPDEHCGEHRNDKHLTHRGNITNHDQGSPANANQIGAPGHTSANLHQVQKKQIPIHGCPATALDEQI